MILLANAVRATAFLVHGTTLQLWGNTFAHLDSIACGILLAIFLRGEIPHIGDGVRAAMIAGAAACLCVRGHFVAITEGERLSWSSTVFGYPMVTASCAVIVMAFVGLRWRPPALCYLGKISYGLYVYHMMCITITDKILGPSRGLRYLAARAILALAITILISSVSYAAIEKPFLRLKRRFTFVPSLPE
jgi:peptidoglycan/LPS O-acetylase OafA/YrhL